MEKKTHYNSLYKQCYILRTIWISFIFPPTWLSGILYIWVNADKWQMTNFLSGWQAPNVLHSSDFWTETPQWGLGLFAARSLVSCADTHHPEQRRGLKERAAFLLPQAAIHERFLPVSWPLSVFRTHLQGDWLWAKRWGQGQLLLLVLSCCGVTLNHSLLLKLHTSHRRETLLPAVPPNTFNHCSICLQGVWAMSHYQSSLGGETVAFPR